MASQTFQSSSSVQQAATTAQAATTGKTTASSRTSIAGNFDTFLTLLTTQLKNQSPLDPLGTNEFTQQLVQFASVEQQIKSNETLNALLISAKTSTVSNAASFVGSRITADGSTSTLSTDGATWQLDFPRAAGEAVITIKDANGSVVATDRKSFPAGSQSYKWDGRSSTGLPAPDGTYTIAINARDTLGQQMSVGTEISGVVDGVDFSSESPTLLIGQNRVPLEGVKSMRK
jgi:flagellar basal-body rod modification protein FlgD